MEINQSKGISFVYLKSGYAISGANELTMVFT